MRDYSFRYLDAQGRTQASDYCQLLNNEAAIAFGRECLARSDVVEVWAGNKLVITLKADASAPAVEAAQHVADAPVPPGLGAPTLGAPGLNRRHPPKPAGAVVVSLPPWTRPPIR